MIPHKPVIRTASCTIRSNRCFVHALRRFAYAIVLAFVGVTGVASAADHAGTPDRYRLVLQKLEPGDRLLLAPGTYTRGLPIHDIQGTAERPIIIQGPPSGPPARFLARDGANTVSLKNAAHIVIDSIELDGMGRNADAVKAESGSRFAHHITLSRLKITGHDANQSLVGIAAQSPAWDWTIRDCVIDGAGTGMYLGRSNGTTGFVGVVIERNVIRNTIGYNIQIKHQRLRPKAPGMPTQPRLNIIRYNVFSKHRHAATGIQARPNLLVGHFPPHGPGADDLHVIYGNVFYDNPTEALFQGEGNIALYNNVFVNPNGPAIHIQPHNAYPRQVAVFNNTVVARTDGVFISGIEPGHDPLVTSNLIFAESPLHGAPHAGNLALSWYEAATYLRAPYSEPPMLDVSPLGSAPARESSLVNIPIGLPEVETDFDGLARAPHTWGAFEHHPAGRPLTFDPAAMAERRP